MRLTMRLTIPEGCVRMRVSPNPISDGSDPFAGRTCLGTAGGMGLSGADYVRAFRRGTAVGSSQREIRQMMNVLGR